MLILSLELAGEGWWQWVKRIKQSWCASMVAWGSHTELRPMSHRHCCSAQPPAHLRAGGTSQRCRRNPGHSHRPFTKLASGVPSASSRCPLAALPAVPLAICSPMLSTMAAGKAACSLSVPRRQRQTLWNILKPRLWCSYNYHFCYILLDKSGEQIQPRFKRWQNRLYLLTEGAANNVSHI